MLHCVCCHADNANEHLKYSQDTEKQIHIKLYHT